MVIPNAVDYANLEFKREIYGRGMELTAIVNLRQEDLLGVRSHPGLHSEYHTSHGDIWKSCLQKERKRNDNMGSTRENNGEVSFLKKRGKARW